MIDWIKQSLKNDKTGEPSSSRMNSTILILCSVLGFLFATFIIGHSYFVRGVIPDTNSILIYFFGGSVGSAIGGGAIYGIGKYSDKNIPECPIDDTIDESIEDSGTHEEERVMQPSEMI